MLCLGEGRDVFKNVLKLPPQPYLELTWRYRFAMFCLWPKDRPEKPLLLIALSLFTFQQFITFLGGNRKWLSLKESASYSTPDSTTKHVFLLACGTIRSSESRVTRPISAGSFWASGWISRSSSTPYQSSLTFKAWSCGMSPHQGWGSWEADTLLLVQQPVSVCHKYYSAYLLFHQEPCENIDISTWYSAKQQLAG